MAIDALLALLIAHQGAFTRTLMLEPSGGELHVVVHASITGKKKELLMFLDEQTRDRMMYERALGDVRLMAGSATVAVENVEVKSRYDGALEVMIHATARIRGSDVSVETAADADPIDLIVLPGDRPVLRATRGAKSGWIKAKMGSGDRIRWTMLVER